MGHSQRDTCLNEILAWTRHLLLLTSSECVVEGEPAITLNTPCQNFRRDLEGIMFWNMHTFGRPRYLWALDLECHMDHGSLPFPTTDMLTCPCSRATIVFWQQHIEAILCRMAQRQGLVSTDWIDARLNANRIQQTPYLHIQHLTQTSALSCSCLESCGL